jgi:hypothetical protein
MKELLMRAVIRKRHVHVAIGAAILLATAAGVAYATIPGPGGVIQGCYAKSNGGLRVIDSPTASCTAKETALAWNQQGAAGPTGPSNAYAAITDLNPHAFSNGNEASLASIDLAPGAYVFNAKVLVGNQGVGNDPFTCSLRYGIGNGVAIDFAATRLATGAPNTAGSMATLPLTGTRSLSEAQTVRLICVTESSGAFAQYAQLNAVKVGALTP